jgi:hypothetical protein
MVYFEENRNEKGENFGFGMKNTGCRNITRVFVNKELNFL